MILQHHWEVGLPNQGGLHAGIQGLLQQLNIGTGALSGNDPRRKGVGVLFRTIDQRLLGGSIHPLQMNLRIAKRGLDCSHSASTLKDDGTLNM